MKLSGDDVKCNNLHRPALTDDDDEGSDPAHFRLTVQARNQKKRNDIKKADTALWKTDSSASTTKSPDSSISEARCKLPINAYGGI